MIPWIESGNEFPHWSNALSDPNGLLAVSDTLTSQHILKAYPQGIFPWSSPHDPILWWTPDPRMVLFPDQFSLRRSLKKRIKHLPYRICINRHFEEVMKACAAPQKNRETTWISPEYIKAYSELHTIGVAHSIEVMIENELVGGLYGISMGHVFFGESMFSRHADASKIALAFLCFILRQYPDTLIDCQIANPHLSSLGAIEIPRLQFMKTLDKGICEASLNWPQMEHWQSLFIKDPEGMPPNESHFIQPGLLTTGNHHERP